MERARAKDFINWDNLWNTEVQTYPYEHIEVDLIQPEFCELIYNELKPGFWDGFVKGHNDLDSAFPVQATGCMNESYAGDMQDALNTWDHWNEWHIEKFGADLGLSHESWPKYGYQGANPDYSFGAHTDNIVDTEVFSKSLIYIHDTVGTKIYDHTLVTHSTFIDQHGDTVTNEVEEPFTVASTELKESNGIGKMFMFKCTDRSFHGTDFSTLDYESRRIILAGTFK